MYLLQTKDKSRASGGPQYYFHGLADHVKEFLRKRGACPVVLQTPYGIANSPFMAVDQDHKIAKDGTVVPGRVGHDRVQGGNQSIGEAIRYWYGIKASGDFKKIDVDVSIHPDGHFILIPTSIELREGKRAKVLERVPYPLSFHHDHKSKLWRQQIDAVREQSSSDVVWAASQIRRVVSEHHALDAKHILESDLLRTAGALSILGLDLGPYLGKGYDCLNSSFRFVGLPMYECPVEVKTRSKGFTYQVTKYTKLPRAIVLCMKHNMVNAPEHIDFIDLPALADYLDG